MDGSQRKATKTGIDRDGGRPSSDGNIRNLKPYLGYLPLQPARKKKEIFPTDRQFQYVVHLVAEITDDLVRR